MTSNLGGEYIKEMTSLGFEASQKEQNKIDQKSLDLKEKILQSLKEYFRPEFINRLDEIIVFNPLTFNDILKIVDLQIAKINKRLEEKEIYLELTEETKKFIAKNGYDPEFGARPLKRYIEKNILDILADKLIQKEIKEGIKVLIDIENNHIVLKEKKPLLKIYERKRGKVKN